MAEARKVVLSQGIHEFPFAMASKLPSHFADTLDGTRPTLLTMRKVLAASIAEAIFARETWILEGIRNTMRDLEASGVSQAMVRDALAMALWIVYNDLAAGAGTEESDGEMRGMFWNVALVENTAVIRMDLATKDHFLYQEMLDTKPAEYMFLFLTRKATDEKVWLIVGMELMMALKSLFLALVNQLPEEAPAESLGTEPSHEVSELENLQAKGDDAKDPERLAISGAAVECISKKEECIDNDGPNNGE